MLIATTSQTTDRKTNTDIQQGDYGTQRHIKFLEKLGLWTQAKQQTVALQINECPEGYGASYWKGKTEQ